MSVVAIVEQWEELAGFCRGSDELSYDRYGVASRMAGFFQNRGKAAAPLSGSRISPAYGRLWVDLRMSAFGYSLPQDDWSKND
jgi:hypothetical protein